MSKLARVTLLQALNYRVGQPMAAWLLHRISGIGIVLFVGLHLFGGFFLYAIEGGPTSTAANWLTDIYVSKPAQIFVLFAMLWHGLNGLRIVVLDMWPALHRFHREAMWVQWALFLPSFLLPALLIATSAKI